MRINTTKTKNQGSVLLVTLCTAWIIGIALVSYLTLVANQHRTTHHSQTWSTCIPVLEAGIEEALTQLNYNDGQGTNNAATYGWTNVSSGVYSKSRVVSTDGSYYEVTINATGATPEITSKGYAPAPQNTGTPMGGQNAFGMILGTVSQSTAAMVSRTVVVGTVLENSGNAKGGLVGKGKITFSGGGTLDSFDSSNPLYSTNGRYDATKRRANGMAMSNAAVSDSIHIDKSFIYGSVATGTGSGTVTITGGSVGDLAWNDNNTETGLNRIESGHMATDANLQFDDVAAPFVYGSGSTPVAGAVDGTNYTYVVNAADNTKWNLAAINLTTGKSLIVTGGDVSLYVNGNVITSGSGFVYIAPGASLKLYVNGTLSVGGTGIMNGAGYASKLSIYGLGTSTTPWTCNGSSTFIGTVYSPYHSFTLNGTAGAYGAFTANNLTISGGASVHYDESLSSGGQPQYIASSWNEI
jgi:hypothetical protein